MPAHSALGSATRTRGSTPPGQAHRGAAAGLRETDRLRDVIGERHRWHAVRGHLHELGGNLLAAAAAYAEAARRATNVAERDHLVRQAARARAVELPSSV